MILADTASEWDNCDFAIVHITDEWRTLMRQRLSRIERFITDEDPCSIRYYDSPMGFYQNDYEKENGIPEDLLDEGEVWCYVTLDENEPEDLLLPESRLDTHILTVYPHGTALFNASGKHTGEEYWTEGFEIAELTGIRFTDHLPHAETK